MTRIPGWLILSEAYAGGQLFEGPWGIVYGGNITPHEELGTGTWSDGELRRAIQSGIRPDGRQLVLMPWEYFVELEEQDIAAVTHYIRNQLEPVARNVRNPDLEARLRAQFIGGSPADVNAGASNDSDNSMLIYGAIAAVVVVLLAAFFLLRRGRSAAKA